MRVFKYDKRKNALIVQSVIMIVIAFLMFFSFYHSRQIIYFVLFAFAIAFVGIYFYRMFLMRVIFDDQSVIFKGLSKQYRIEKEDIYAVNILSQVGREVLVKEYREGDKLTGLSKRSYVVIRANDKPLITNLSMFNAATADYISLEYTPGIEVYIDKLLHK